MITKVEGKVIPNGAAITDRLRLSAIERGLIKWAIIDPEDKVLDASIGEGVMAEYIRRNLQCEICGVSDSMEDVRRARCRLQSADIVYASTGDIPWKENSFDTIFVKLKEGETGNLRKILKEAKRVLKEDGQLLLGMSCYPSGLRTLSKLMTDNEAAESEPLLRKDIVEMLVCLGLEDMSWQRIGLMSLVIIAWKRHPLSLQVQ